MNSSYVTKAEINNATEKFSTLLSTEEAVIFEDENSKNISEPSFQFNSTVSGNSEDYRRSFINSGEEVVNREIIKEMEGVIIEVRDAVVKVKLHPDTIVDFPKILFNGKDFVKYGQPIKYQIKQNAFGIRYQDFDISEDKSKNIFKDKIKEQLDSIKLRKI